MAGAFDTVAAAPAPTTAAATGRPDRAQIIAFIADPTSERIVREGLAQQVTETFEIHRGGVRTAISILQKVPTPQVLLVDVSGESDALMQLADLSEVVEPDVRVLVIGDRQDVNFYRQITRGLGVVEYLYKPLTREMVATHFALALGRNGSPPMVQGGRVISITGASGGAGATTITVSLATYLAEEANRHVIVLDANLYTGTVAMLLSARTGPGLRSALETPDRIDELFVERSARPVSERLHVLAGEEALTEQFNYTHGAAESLLRSLRRRYNFIFLDVPFSPAPLNRELLAAANQRVLVMNPTLASIRDTLRLLALPQGPLQVRRAVIVLDRLGMPGGLSRQQVEAAMGVPVDVVVPYVPRQILQAGNLGQSAIGKRGGFRTGILSLTQEVGSMHATQESSTVRLKRTLLRHVLKRGKA